MTQTKDREKREGAEPWNMILYYAQHHVNAQHQIIHQSPAPSSLSLSFPWVILFSHHIYITSYPLHIHVSILLPFHSKPHSKSQVLGFYSYNHSLLVYYIVI